MYGIPRIYRINSNWAGDLFFGRYSSFLFSEKTGPELDGIARKSLTHIEDLLAG